jgi:bla regulator protein blaR1
MRTDAREMLALGMLGRKSRLRERIEVLLRGRRTFSATASPAGVFASVLALTALMLASPLAPRWIAFAQQESRPAFEVASVKPGDPAARQVGIQMQKGGRFRATNAPLQMLIGFAWDLRNHQISGGPQWLASEKFSIDAKPGSDFPSAEAGPAMAPQIRLMVQSLLADRFHLATHFETRQEQIYELVAAKGGPKLKEVTDPPVSGPRGLRMGRGELVGMSSPINLLVNTLSQQLGHSVIDKTGLTGNYDFKLQFTPDPTMSAAGPADGSASPPVADASAPSIFTAAEEQLGLQLRSAKGPVQVLVIDHVEKPDAD